VKETITFRIPKAIRENKLDKEILSDFTVALANYIDKINNAVKNRVVNGLNVETRLIDDVTLELTGEGFVFHVTNTDDSAIETIDIIEHLIAKKTMQPSAIATLILRAMRLLLQKQVREHDELVAILGEIVIA